MIRTTVAAALVMFGFSLWQPGVSWGEGSPGVKAEPLSPYIQLAALDKKSKSSGKKIGKG